MGPVTLSPNELRTLQSEAWEAFEYESPRGKTDSRSRIWTFEPHKRNGTIHVAYSIRRPGSEPIFAFLSAPQTNFRALRPESDALITQLAGQLQ